MGNLAETHPELAAQWHPTLNGSLKPTDVTAGASSKSPFWICDLGHTWKAVIPNRAKGSGCPYCSNQAVWLGFNDLESQSPEIARDWDWDKNSLKPSEVVVKSTRRAWWLCAQGHSWDAQISSRTGQGTGCPYCAGIRILPGYNDLATVNPPYLTEWNYKKNSVKPSEIGPAVRKSAWWTCPEGHDYESTLSQRSRGHGCPYCSSKKVLPGRNDLKSQYPQIAQYWDEERNGKPASEAHQSSPKKFWFKCNLGHSYKSSTNALAGRSPENSGCPICSGKTLLKGFNDLATLLPDVAKLWNTEKNGDLTPADVTKASTKVVWWKCLKDKRHEWQATVASRSRGQGCPVCTSRLVMAGINDLFSVAPQLSDQWHPTKNKGLNPLTLTAETPKKVWWTCEKDSRHEWQAQIDSRSKRGLGCPICSNKKTVPGMNDMRTTHPHLAKEFNEVRSGVLASEINAGNHKNFWWTCTTCQAEWKASPINRSRVNSGCPKCAKSGYDATSDGYLYLLRKESEGLQQFGITNAPNKRTNQHKKNGWELLDIVGPADGYWVVDTETALKAFFESKGLLLARNYGDKFDGYTESWKSTSLKFSTVAQMLAALREFEDKEKP